MCTKCCRQAVCDQCILESSPFHYEPHISVIPPPNAPPALMIHPSVPVQQFPRLPHNLIEWHEVNCVCATTPTSISASTTHEVRHHDIFYEGVAQPGHNHNQHMPMQPFAHPQGPHQPMGDFDQFNVQFHQHTINFQRNADEEQQYQMELEQAKHQHRQNELLARHQAHEAHLHFEAEQAQFRLEAEQIQLHFEVEQHHQNEVAQQELLIQQHREYEQ
ncbi:hypothetical protein BS17DRAFT_763322 [Gyrodon lividus]|nr:hypothetical protein BS17DRAFT_763322 [Gyrodon lividus]